MMMREFVTKILESALFVQKIIIIPVEIIQKSVQIIQKNFSLIISRMGDRIHNAIILKTIIMTAKM